LIHFYNILHFHCLQYWQQAIKQLFPGVGEPKAIPWTNATPFKAAADAWCHMDIHKGDIVAWPTNLGWMMGPWLIFASLLNGASMALYNGSPLGSGFAKFVQVNNRCS
jgi:acyl-coenzyme A synthetase/AMP-(fatty) acid ligase